MIFNDMYLSIINITTQINIIINEIYGKKNVYVKVYEMFLMMSRSHVCLKYELNREGYIKNIINHQDINYYRYSYKITIPFIHISIGIVKQLIYSRKSYRL